MSNERKAEIKVGITTILALIIFIWLMGWAKNFMVSTDDIELDIIFDNVSGLEVDDDVTVRGLRKGFVKNIYLDKNIILVKISIDEQVDLRNDAVFMLATMDLMGGKKIEIIPGMANELLNRNAIHTGTFLPDLSSLMGTIGEIREDFMTIVTDVKITLTSINSYLTDESLKTDIKTSLKNLHSLTGKVDKMLSENHDNVATITSNTAKLTTDAKQLLNDNKDNLSISIKRLRSVLTEADTLISNFNFLTQETMNGKNNLGKALYNDSLMVDFTQILSDLKVLTNIILLQMGEDGIKVDANIW
ncbi:MlaD family protein [Bacteroidota bacterium]